MVIFISRLNRNHETLSNILSNSISVKRNNNLTLAKPGQMSSDAQMKNERGLMVQSASAGKSIAIYLQKNKPKNEIERKTEV